MTLFGTAEIVSITQGVGALQSLSPEDLLVHKARVSNPSSQRKAMNNEKLIAYLIRRAEWSPFETITVGFEITTTRDIGRQILRHKTLSFQEFSQRYADVGALEVSGPVLREARLAHPTNRQSSVECEDANVISTWNTRQKMIVQLTQDSYKWAIANGLAPEVARAVLPEGMTPTKMYASGPLRTWLHYYALRTDSYTDERTGEEVIPTQKEHRHIAQLVGNELKKWFPATMKAWEETRK